MSLAVWGCATQQPWQRVRLDAWIQRAQADALSY